MLPLPWPFDREYLQLALVGGLVVGVTAPLIGTFLVQKRLSLLGDGLGHVAFAGVAAGLFFGIWPIGPALVGAVLAACSIEWLRSRGRASGDLALAVFFYSGIAGGVVLIGLAGSLDASTLTYLFGSILTVSPDDAVVIGLLGLLIVGVIGLTWRALFAVVLDEQSARVAGLPVDRLNLVLAALAAVTVVAGMRVVGVLLVAALMVLPVGAANRIGGSFRGTMLAASGIGGASAVVGLAVARGFNLAPGATIVLVAAAVFLVTAVIGRRPLPALAGPGQERGVNR
ncbi:MAG: metal ABC transporter permease [Acidimicrobiales bacterium]